MTERELTLLGFEKQAQPGSECSDSNGNTWKEGEFHYYTYDVCDGVSFISNASDEVEEGGEWFVEFFNSDPEIRFTEFGEVQALINLLESRKIKRDGK